MNPFLEKQNNNKKSKTTKTTTSVSQNFPHNFERSLTASSQQAEEAKTCLRWRDSPCPCCLHGSTGHCDDWSLLPESNVRGRASLTASAPAARGSGLDSAALKSTPSAAGASGNGEPRPCHLLAGRGSRWGPDEREPKTQLPTHDARSKALFSTGGILGTDRVSMTTHFGGLRPQVQQGKETLRWHPTCPLRSSRAGGLSFRSQEDRTHVAGPADWWPRLSPGNPGDKSTGPGPAAAPAAARGGGRPPCSWTLASAHR